MATDPPSSPVLPADWAVGACELDGIAISHGGRKGTPAFDAILSTGQPPQAELLAPLLRADLPPGSIADAHPGAGTLAFMLAVAHQRRAVIWGGEEAGVLSDAAELIPTEVEVLPGTLGGGGDGVLPRQGVLSAPVALLHVQGDSPDPAFDAARPLIERDQPLLLLSFADPQAGAEVLKGLKRLDYACVAVLGPEATHLFAHRGQHRSFITLWPGLQRQVLDGRGQVLPAPGAPLMPPATLPAVEAYQDLIQPLHGTNHQRRKCANRAQAEASAIKDALPGLVSALQGVAKAAQAVDPTAKLPNPTPAQTLIKRATQGVNQKLKPGRPYGMDYLLHPVERDRPVRIGIAAIPSRQQSLRYVLEGLAPQADEIFVSLNGFTELPDWQPPANVTLELSDNIGDFAKFKYLTKDFQGYYLTCDDDIAYPPYYVDSIIHMLQTLNHKALVGWHGSVLVPKATDYYDPTQRRIRFYDALQAHPHILHVLGTGCLGLSAWQVRPPYSIFRRPNMADIFLADWAQRQRIPCVLVPHLRGEARDISYLNTDRASISSASYHATGQVFDVRAAANKLVAGRRWRLHTPKEWQGLRPFLRRLRSHLEYRETRIRKFGARWKRRLRRALGGAG